MVFYENNGKKNFNGTKQASALKVFLVDINKWAFMCGFFTFAEEIFKGNISCNEFALSRGKSCSK